MRTTAAGMYFMKFKTTLTIKFLDSKTDKFRFIHFAVYSVPTCIWNFEVFFNKRQNNPELKLS